MRHTKASVISKEFPRNVLHPKVRCRSTILMLGAGACSITRIPAQKLRGIRVLGRAHFFFLKASFPFSFFYRRANYYLQALCHLVNSDNNHFQVFTLRRATIKTVQPIMKNLLSCTSAVERFCTPHAGSCTAHGGGTCAERTNQ